MSSLNILSGGAAQGLVGSLSSTFKAQTGLEIAGEFGAVCSMAEKLRGGMPADMVILTSALVAKLAEEKLVVAASMADVGLVETALAVRTGDPQATASDATGLRDALRPGGRIAIIDFTLNSPDGPPKNARIAPERVKTELERAGYTLVQEHTFLPNQYFLIFQPRAT